MGDQNEIRASRKAVAAGVIAGWFGQSLVRTLKIKIAYRCEGPLTDGPRIFALWHNRMLGAVSAAKPWQEFRSGVVLTSASDDGATVAAAMEVFGLGAIRGSSSRRGAAALVQLKKAIQGGLHVCITPDGPRGPLYEVHPGMVKLASVTQVPIIPFLVHYERYWELKSWDKFQIPKPFSKVTITFGEEIKVPSKLNEEEFELMRKKVELSMSEGLNTAEE